jgi:quercetin 2,3-dioxygenase
MMTKLREIEKIIPPPPIHWVGDGFKVHNFIPGNGTVPLNRLSPFFLIDYNAPTHFPATESPRGVGVHPHRGFETVTLAYQGVVAHHDSAGNSGVIYPGDVQWMTAASGVLHKEYHQKEWSSVGGVFQMVQLWVNLPAKYKMSAPKYQAISQNEFATYQLENDLGSVEVIAGAYKNAKGKAFTFSPIEMYNLRATYGAFVEFQFPSNHNTCFLLLDGLVSVNSRAIPTHNLVMFENSEGTIQVDVISENAVLLILSGEPIEEPIFAYGPFLMNNKQEVIEAYRDLERGKFGYLED